jgi:hypothetical protein
MNPTPDVSMRLFFEVNFGSQEICHAARKTLSQDGLPEARDNAIDILGGFSDYLDWKVRK